MKYESEVFLDYKTAKSFSNKVNGYIDGPFLYDDYDKEYIVFYKVKEYNKIED